MIQIEEIELTDDDRETLLSAQKDLAEITEKDAEAIVRLRL